MFRLKWLWIRISMRRRYRAGTSWEPPRIRDGTSIPAKQMVDEPLAHNWARLSSAARHRRLSYDSPQRGSQDQHAQASLRVHSIQQGSLGSHTCFGDYPFLSGNLKAVWAYFRLNYWMLLLRNIAVANFHLPTCRTRIDASYSSYADIPRALAASKPPNPNLMQMQ